MQSFVILITCLSLIGVVLNIQKKRSCFVFWTFTNASWVFIDWKAGIYPQAFLFFVYFALSVWGWFKWKE